MSWEWYCFPRSRTGWPRVRARLAWAAVGLFIAMAACPQTCCGEPLITAVLDLESGDTTMRGSVQFDLGGGAVDGHADCNMAADPQDPPQRAGGAGAQGRFRVRVELAGTYDGGSFGVAQGSAIIRGTFTDESGCEAQLQGQGTFRGSVSGPLGGVEIACEWPEIALQGCDLASGQPFAANLHFSFEPTAAIPRLNSTAGVAESTGSGGLWIILGLWGLITMAIFNFRRARKWVQSKWQR